MKKLLTLVIIYQPPRILLGLKKRGFGVGKWNGLGGKVEANETIEAAARREVQEEASIEVGNLDRVGILDFEFPGDSDVRQVHVFKSDDFTGEPTESEEMKPQWFNVEDIPYDEMWPDDKYWLPLFLNGRKFQGKFIFNKPNVISEKELIEVAEL